MRITLPTKALSKSKGDVHGPNPFFTFGVMFATQQNSHDQLTAMWQEFQLEPIVDHSAERLQRAPIWRTIRSGAKYIEMSWGF